MNYPSIMKRLSSLSEDDPHLVFTPSLYGEDALRPIAADWLILRKGSRHITFCSDELLPFEVGTQTETVECYAHKTGYTHLGVLLFHLLLSGQSYAEVQLVHSDSAFTRLYLYREQPGPPDPLLSVRHPETYASYEYIPQKVSKFPFSGHSFSERDIDPKALPSFYLGWSDSRQAYQPNRIEQADQLIVMLDVAGLCALASLFIDMGRADNEQREVCLEHPTSGFGGVGPNSMEARFWLPNSMGFYTDHLDDLRFSS